MFYKTTTTPKRRKATTKKFNWISNVKQATTGILTNSIKKMFVYLMVRPTTWKWMLENFPSLIGKAENFIKTLFEEMMNFFGG